MKKKNSLSKTKIIVAAGLLSCCMGSCMLTSSKAYLTQTQPSPPAAEEVILSIPRPLPTTYPRLEKYVGEAYEFDIEDIHLLSTALWSVTPLHPTYETKLAFCEVVQNRADFPSGEYGRTFAHVLNQQGEFKNFSPDAFVSDENVKISEYSMQTWLHGDPQYRYTPKEGINYSFYTKDKRSYIIVYDLDNNIVFDSGMIK